MSIEPRTHTACWADREEKLLLVVYDMVVIDMGFKNDSKGFR